MITIGEAIELTPGVPEVFAALLALDAVVVFALPEEHRLALSEVGLAVEQPRLPRKGLIVALELPEASDQIWGEAHVARTPADEAIVGVMAALEVVRPGIVRAARIALCGAGPEPARLAGAAGLLAGQALTDEQIERAVAGVQAEAAPVGDYRGSADYRRAMVGVLTRRALLQAREQLAEGG
jgi:CO/xanthine dehydrogenase FAD-binding subunit